MKAQERVALIFGISLLGAGGLAYFRGRRGLDLVTDTAFYGLAAGTAINGAWFFASMATETQNTLISAANPGGLLGALFREPQQASGMGSVPSKAVRLLAQIDQDKLFAAMKSGGVKVAEAPEDPHIISQDEV